MADSGHRLQSLAAGSRYSPGIVPPYKLFFILFHRGLGFLGEGLNRRREGLRLWSFPRHGTRFHETQSVYTWRGRTFRKHNYKIKNKIRHKDSEGPGSCGAISSLVNLPPGSKRSAPPASLC